MACRVEDDKTHLITWDPMKVDATLRTVQKQLRDLDSMQARTYQTYVLGKKLIKAVRIVAKPVQQASDLVHKRLHEVHSNLVQTITRQFSYALHDPKTFNFSVNQFDIYHNQGETEWLIFNEDFKATRLLATRMRQLAESRAFGQLIPAARVLAQNLAKLTLSTALYDRVKTDFRLGLDETPARKVWDQYDLGATYEADGLQLLAIMRFTTAYLISGTEDTNMADLLYGCARNKLKTTRTRRNIMSDGLSWIFGLETTDHSEKVRSQLQKDQEKAIEKMMLMERHLDNIDRWGQEILDTAKKEGDQLKTIGNAVAAGMQLQNVIRALTITLDALSEEMTMIETVLSHTPQEFSGAVYFNRTTIVIRRGEGSNSNRAFLLKTRTLPFRFNMTTLQYKFPENLVVYANSHENEPVETIEPSLCSVGAICTCGKPEIRQRPDKCIKNVIKNAWTGDVIDDAACEGYLHKVTDPTQELAVKRGPGSTICSYQEQANWLQFVAAR